LSLDENRFRENLVIPEYLEEVHDFPDGNLTLFHRGRNIGIGFKRTDSEGNVRLFWIKRRDLMRFARDWQPRIIEGLSRMAIPAERYEHYPFLSP
jgi:hypothetical protein